MITNFSSVVPFLKFKRKTISIDNLAFKLHYRWTFIILLVSTILVTSRQYIGEHIRCINDGGVPNHVINTFCFFTSTFTMIRHKNESLVDTSITHFSNIGPNLSQYEEDPIKKHAYYQWVPFVLFGQAILFYFPHYLWKTWEGGKIKILVNGLQMVSISKYLEKQKLNYGDVNYPSKDETDNRLKFIKFAFLSRLKANPYWAWRMMFCELLNLFNIILQIYFTNKFLNGQFYTLGDKILNQNLLTKSNILDIVFPKLTKCHFHKFGASGSLQIHDALCIMALNIINEKIYTFLWFWFVILLICSMLAIIWRLLIIIIHRSTRFNAFAFSYNLLGPVNRYELDTVTQMCSFSSWMFLYYLGKNLDENLFKELLSQLSKEFYQNKYVKINTVIEQQHLKMDEVSDLEEQAIDTVDYGILKEKNLN